MLIDGKRCAWLATILELMSVLRSTEDMLCVICTGSKCLHQTSGALELFLYGRVSATDTDMQ